MNLLWLQINFARFQAEEFTLNLGWGTIHKRFLARMLF